MKTLLLSNRDLREIVRRVEIDHLMDQMIDRLMAALVSFDVNQTEIPVRRGFHYESPVTGMIEWMPLLQKQREVLMKVVGYHPQSPDTLRLPTVLSTLSKYDPTTGHLTALVDGTFLTAMRTGAASAVASRLLAKPDSVTLGLIGCGAQAVTQLHAISRRFKLAEVLIYDVDQCAMETYPRRVAAIVPKHVDIYPVSVREVVSTADILCVATSIPIGRGPVFAHYQTKPWIHVNAVGSDFPGKIEIPKALLLESFVCPDTLGQAQSEGECQQLAAEQIGADLVTVAQAETDNQQLQEQKTVFDSTGWALEDQVAMDVLLEHARKYSIGTEVEIEYVSDDPRNPYEFLERSQGQQRNKFQLKLGAGS